MSVSSTTGTSPRAATATRDRFPTSPSPERPFLSSPSTCSCHPSTADSEPQEHGGRPFDAAPGLAPALAAEPIVIDTGARLLNGTVLEFAVRVPTVELALVIKALAYGSRRQARDIEDIYRLLEIADTYPSDEIGGWRLHDTPLRASRRDAAGHLHELAGRSRRLVRRRCAAGATCHAHRFPGWSTRLNRDCVAGPRIHHLGGACTTWSPRSLRRGYRDA